MFAGFQPAIGLRIATRHKWLLPVSLLPTLEIESTRSSRPWRRDSRLVVRARDTQEFNLITADDQTTMMMAMSAAMARSKFWNPVVEILIKVIVDVDSTSFFLFVNLVQRRYRPIRRNRPTENRWQLVRHMCSRHGFALSINKNLQLGNGTGREGSGKQREGGRIYGSNRPEKSGKCW